MTRTPAQRFGKLAALLRHPHALFEFLKDSVYHSSAVCECELPHINYKGYCVAASFGTVPAILFAKLATAAMNELKKALVAFVSAHSRKKSEHI
jgi:hypothetical protein